MSLNGRDERRENGAIRICGPEDVALLHRMSVETYVDTFAGTSSEEDMNKFLEESYSEPVLHGELSNPDSVFLLISVQPDSDSEEHADSDSSNSTKTDEIPSGYMKLNFGKAQVEDMGAGTMEIQRLYISKRFKGHGFGTRLMNLALKTARERDLHKVWLGVWEHNEPAKRFYSGKGFVRVGQHAFWQGDDKQTDYLMARDL
ncbi:GNAT family N-acetyltransferase [Bifidobacterium sp. ESL0798]|uniref:GNAT family N-acetyltransferase n=1 Tax=Bifidobacterium sp. ESL0798 TaxID=2983235 RepID=UPI0023F9C544|nr:GNAT family N-acetyltransferase [Bifidobacterium sp. ESL0798]WEV73769.1 GNAT family N-acetyltransferase [Bifidobacterium sp. ESL0798]